MLKFKILGHPESSDSAREQQQHPPTECAAATIIIIDHHNHIYTVHDRTTLLMMSLYSHTVLCTHDDTHTHSRVPWQLIIFSTRNII